MISAFQSTELGAVPSQFIYKNDIDNEGKVYATI